MDFSPAFVWLAGKPQGDLGLIQTVWGWWCDGGGGFQSFQVPATKDRTPWFEFLVIFDLFSHHGHSVEDQHCMSRHAARVCSRSRAIKKCRLSQKSWSSCCRMSSKEKLDCPGVSMTYFWNVVHVLLWGWGGGNLLISDTSSSHRRLARLRRWLTFLSLSRLFKHIGLHEDLGRQPRFSCSQCQKHVCHSWDTTSLATMTGIGCSKMCRIELSYGLVEVERQKQTVKSLSTERRCSERNKLSRTTSQLDTNRVREIESNATLTKKGIVHALRMRTALVESAVLTCQSSLHGLRSRST